MDHRFQTLIFKYFRLLRTKFLNHFCLKKFDQKNKKTLKRKHNFSHFKTLRFLIHKAYDYPKNMWIHRVMKYF